MAYHRFHGLFEVEVERWYIRVKTGVTFCDRRIYEKRVDRVHSGMDLPCGR